MTVSFAQIAKNTASVTFPVGDDNTDTLTIVYYPSLITEATIAELKSFQNADGVEATLASFGKLNELLASLIKSWDLLNEDGSMYPLEPGALAKVPMMFRVEVLQAIMGDIRPDPEVIAPRTLN